MEVTNMREISTKCRPCEQEGWSSWKNHARVLLLNRPVSEGLSKSTEVFYYINLGEPHPCRSVADSQSAAGKRRSSDMFKLVVLSCLLAVALAKPSEIAPAIVGNLISEKSIESHGNSVVHSVAPVVAPVVAPAIPLVKTMEPVLPVTKAAAVVAEKTIESHGHSIVHHSAPAAAVSYLTQATPVVSAAPLAITEIKQLSEKSQKTQETLEKLESSQQSKQLLEKIENVGRQAINNEASNVSPKAAGIVQASERTESQERNESEKSRQLSEKNESYGQLILHQQPAPATLSYLAATPLVSALTPVAPSVIAHTLKTGNVVEKSESLQSKQLAEKLEALENSAIQEAAPLLHATLHAAPFAYAASAPAAHLYYYSYPAAVLAEKSISSYGHSIVHGA
ncbi:hypothetical protein HZH68_011002 [Vespula germanica]|uniref:Uncharacterized protein n=1 Tax=Vespula germanica TaxID=30212 RepID=A0A834N1E3_VESGE|nr:hypothetical protein HZH68_011002 [Vespula germanica]